jgi:hypothetical protein
MFEAHELQAVLKEAEQPLKAMILLALSACKPWSNTFTVGYSVLWPAID